MTSEPRPFPPSQCTAKAKRTQMRCERWAIQGGRVCSIHGGKIPRVRAKAMERVLIADGLRHGAYRAPHEVLLSAMREMDVVKQALINQITQGDPSEPVDFERLVDAIDRTVKYSKIVLDAGVQERQVRASEGMAHQLVTVMRGVMEDVGLTPAQWELVPAAVSRRVAELTGEPRRVIEGA